MFWYLMRKAMASEGDYCSEMGYSGHTGSAVHEHTPYFQPLLETICTFHDLVGSDIEVLANSLIFGVDQLILNMFDGVIVLQFEPCCCCDDCIR